MNWVVAVQLQAYSELELELECLLNHLSEEIDLESSKRPVVS